MDVLVRFGNEPINPGYEKILSVGNIDMYVQQTGKLFTLIVENWEINKGFPVVIHHYVYARQHDNTLECKFTAADVEAILIAMIRMFEVEIGGAIKPLSNMVNVGDRYIINLPDVLLFESMPEPSSLNPFSRAIQELNVDGL